MLVKRWSNVQFGLFFLMPTPKDGKLFRPAPPSAVDLRPSVTAELISKRRLPDMSSHGGTTHDRMRFCKSMREIRINMYHVRVVNAYIYI